MIINKNAMLHRKKSIDRKLLANSAKEISLNSSYLEAPGERQHWEIIVAGDMLDLQFEIQHRFE